MTGQKFCKLASQSYYAHRLRESGPPIFLIFFHVITLGEKVVLFKEAYNFSKLIKKRRKNSEQHLLMLWSQILGSFKAIFLDNFLYSNLVLKIVHLPVNIINYMIETKTDICYLYVSVVCIF